MPDEALTEFLRAAGVFQFDLPPEKIALEPLDDPLEAKLLSCLGGELRDYQVKDLLRVLPEKCLLVFNDTKVWPARLLLGQLKEESLQGQTFRSENSAPSAPGRASAADSPLKQAESGKPAAGKAADSNFPRSALEASTEAGKLDPKGSQPKAPETSDRVSGKIFDAKVFDAIILQIEPPDRAIALIQQSKKLRLGDRLAVLDGEHKASGQSCEVLSKNLTNGEVTLQFQAMPDLESFLSRTGLAPLPPYILKRKKQRDHAKDKRRYQSVLAQNLGSLAAPTASFHFTPALIEAIKKSGRTLATITLHVGRGTFAPLNAANFSSGKLFPESYQISPDALTKILEAKKNGWPVVAVGTTVLRALESAFRQGPSAGFGTTELFIRPGFRFRCVDCLLTNFHLSASSLLILVQAFAGDLIEKAYHHALAKDYRFYSFGDCMLVEKQSEA